MLADSEVQRALIVTAHPDDVDFAAAGTVATWTAAGIEVTYCVCTDGDAGGFDREVARADIPRIRRAEQEAAAKEVGVSDVRFLGHQDGCLEPTQDLRKDISRVIRQVRPQRMIISSPERNWKRLPASHPDHLAAGEAAIFAIYPDSRNPFAHLELLRDEGLEPWSVSEAWVMAHATNDHYVDITDVFDRKLAALHAHGSQIAHVEGFDDRMRGWFSANAVAGGLPDGHLAEAFMVVPTVF
jgi:LmbE family N-acetylglucosaminyl deacetylase